ncbi:hypothetical protein [Vulcanisaeta thermophila]|uniref:hypothetical protein n=1 Tax=Vulcanisaeta thermophila TaxID=867917 RepID=UPI000853DCF0|nr:hypothetical protein [Vulcanisaeta thermophila]
MDSGITEARNYLEKLLSKGWFRHAVGSRGVKYLTELLRFVDLHNRECSVSMDLNSLMELLDDYYSAEVKIRYFLRELLRVQGDTVSLIRRVYPLLPPDIRELFDRVLSTTPQDAPNDALINGIVDALVQEMEDFKGRLTRYITWARENCTNQAYNQTS